MTLSAIRATVLLANRPRVSTRTETSRYWAAEREAAVRAMEESGEAKIV